MKRHMASRLKAKGIKRKKPIKALHNRAKEAFNRWVRHRDVPGFPPCDGITNTCVCCKKRVPMNKINAGHFYHGKNWMSAMHELNVWPSCIVCNFYLSGNLIEYSEFLRKAFGVEIIDQLRELRHTPWKPSRDDLERTIGEYEDKLAGVKITLKGIE